MITITLADNGYILNIGQSTTRCKVFTELEPMFKWILQDLAGVSSSFGGNSFGEVKINLDHKMRLTVIEDKK